MSEKAVTRNTEIDVKDELNKLLREFIDTGDSASPDMKQDWRERYNAASSSLLQEYFECIRREDYERAYVLNRQIYLVAKRTRNEAQKKTDAHLYAMGVFHGVYASCKKMTELESEEQIFYFKMSKIVERKYIKDILKYVYRNDGAQNKQICAALQIQSNLLSKALHPLLDADCLVRFVNGKNTFYSLSQFGKKYVKKVLGYTADDVVEERIQIITSYTSSRKPNGLQYIEELNDTGRKSILSTGNEKYQREDMYGRNKEGYTRIRQG